MPYFRDRVKDTSTSTGTGNFTLSGTAPISYQSFNTAFGLDTAFTYCIVDSTSGLWETGTGYLSSSTTLVRDDNVFDGSSGPGVLVNFTAGDKEVICTIVSHWCEDVDSGTSMVKAQGWALP